MKHTVSKAELYERKQNKSQVPEIHQRILKWPKYSEGRYSKIYKNNRKILNMLYK